VARDNPSPGELELRAAAAAAAAVVLSPADATLAQLSGGAELPDMSDDEFVKWMHGFIEASERESPAEEEMLHKYAQRQLTKHKVQRAQSRPCVGLGGLKGSRLPLSFERDPSKALDVSGKAVRHPAPATTPMSRPASSGNLAEIQFSQGSGVNIVRANDGGYTYSYYETKQEEKEPQPVLSPVISDATRRPHTFKQRQEKQQREREQQQGPQASTAAVDWDLRDVGGLAVQGKTAAHSTSRHKLAHASDAMPSLQVSGDAFRLPHASDLKAASMAWSDNLPSIVADMSAHEKEQAWDEFQSSGMSSAAQQAYQELMLPPLPNLVPQSQPTTAPTFVTHLKDDQRSAKATGRRDSTTLPPISVNETMRMTHADDEATSSRSPEKRDDDDADGFVDSQSEQDATPRPFDEQKEEAPAFIVGVDSDGGAAATNPLMDLERNEEHIEAALRSLMLGLAAGPHGSGGEGGADTFWGQGNDTPQNEFQVSQSLPELFNTTNMGGHNVDSDYGDSDYADDDDDDDLPLVLEGSRVSIGGVARRTHALKKREIKRASPQPSALASLTRRRNAAATQRLQQRQEQTKKLPRPRAMSLKATASLSPSSEKAARRAAHDTSFDKEAMLLASQLASDLFVPSLSSPLVHPDTPMPVHGLLEEEGAQERERAEQRAGRNQTDLGKAPKLNPPAPPRVRHTSDDGNDDLGQEKACKDLEAGDKAASSSGLIASEVPPPSDRALSMTVESVAVTKAGSTNSSVRDDEDEEDESVDSARGDEQKSKQPVPKTKKTGAGKTVSKPTKRGSTKATNNNKKKAPKKKRGEKLASGVSPNGVDDDEAEAGAASGGSEDGEGEEGDKEVTLDEILVEAVVSQPLVHVREQAKKVEKGKRGRAQQKAPWSHFTNEDMLKSLSVEKALRDLAASNSMEVREDDDDFTVGGGSVLSQLKPEDIYANFSTRRRRGPIGN